VEDKFAIFPLPAGVSPIPCEPLRFHVRSRTRSQVWLVDLEEYGFNGKCDCENFRFVHLPRLREDKEKGVKKWRRCYHIQRAFEFYGALHSRLMAQEYYKRQQPENDGKKVYTLDPTKTYEPRKTPQPKSVNASAH